MCSRPALARVAENIFHRGPNPLSAALPVLDKRNFKPIFRIFIAWINIQCFYFEKLDQHCRKRGISLKIPYLFNNSVRSYFVKNVITLSAHLNKVHSVPTFRCLHCPWNIVYVPFRRFRKIHVSATRGINSTFIMTELSIGCPAIAVQ